MPRGVKATQWNTRLLLQSSVEFSQNISNNSLSLCLKPAFFIPGLRSPCCRKQYGKQKRGTCFRLCNSGRIAGPGLGHSPPFFTLQKSAAGTFSPSKGMDGYLQEVGARSVPSKHRRWVGSSTAAFAASVKTITKSLCYGPVSNAPVNGIGGGVGQVGVENTPIPAGAKML
jgi:hypothetical protein